MGASFFGERLNYSLGNEDTRLELAVLPERATHVCAVAGSGGRVLPLLARHPSRLTCIDLSQAQLFLAEVRLEAARSLTCEQYRAFLGYPPSPATPRERRALSEQLVTLSLPARRFWDGLMEAAGYESVLYRGQWEATFVRLSRWVQLITGGVAGLFDATSRAELEAYLRHGFPRRRWHLALRLLANARVFNALLYHGSFPRKNLAQGYYRFYRERFEHLFAQGLPRENFFLQLAFLGKLAYPEGNPVECDPEVYDRAKSALGTVELQYVRADLLSEQTSLAAPVDFLSLSDVASYLSGPGERTFLQRLRPKLAPGARVVARYYLHVPEGTDASGYRRATARYRDAIAREKVGVYEIEIFEAEEAPTSRVAPAGSTSARNS